MINDLLRSVTRIYIAYGVTDFRKQIRKRSIKRHIETSNLILYNWTRV